MTCCTISEKFPPVRNWSVEKEKKAQARSRATRGPVVEEGAAGGGMPDYD
jgi:hypothetical protein